MLIIKQDDRIYNLYINIPNINIQQLISKNIK